MSGRPSCLPPREEILGFVGGALVAPEKWVVEEQADNLDALIVGAVEQALAEREARHRRELIEARLEELIDYGECTCVTLGGTCAAHVHENELRADLAALEVTP